LHITWEERSSTVDVPNTVRNHLKRKDRRKKVDGDFGLVKATVCYFVGGAPKGEIESHVEGYWRVGYLEMADMNDESGKTRQAKLCGRSDFVRSLMNN